jgi:ABC-2 type transport system permease protein
MREGVLRLAGRARVLAAGARVVFSRETGAYFDSPIAYVAAAAFLLLANALFMNGFFLAGVVDMAAWFDALPLLLVFFVPALAMRTWAEERAQGTIELVLTLPVTAGQVIAGKYLAALAFYLVVLLGSLPIVVMLLWLGGPDLGRITSSYFGAAFLGALFLAVGLFLSSLTRDQIVAFVLAAFACALLVLSGHREVVDVLDGLAPNWGPGTWLYETVSVVPHYEAFCRGIVSLGDVAYFGVLSAFFLVANALVLRLARL